jgi:hypothetical protein
MIRGRSDRSGSSTGRRPTCGCGAPEASHDLIRAGFSDREGWAEAFDITILRASRTTIDL